MKTLDERVSKSLKAGFDTLREVPLVTSETAEAAFEQNEEKVKAFMRPHDDVRSEDRIVPGRDGNPDVRIRILEKQGRTEKAPLVFYIHGGGMYLGSVPTSEGGAVMAVRGTDCVAVMPEYRLAWQAPYPAALNDCYTALCWVVEHADELNIDAERIVLYGASAGSNLVCALSLLARDKGYPKITAQIPLQPMLDYRCDTPSMREFDDLRCWNASQNKLAWEMYLGKEPAGPVSAYASPSIAENFSDLPPTFFYVGALDPFRDEAIAYAQNLLSAGVFVDFRVVGGAYHAFEAAFCPMVMECMNMTLEFMKRAFSGMI